MSAFTFQFAWNLRTPSEPGQDASTLTFFRREFQAAARHHAACSVARARPEDAPPENVRDTRVSSTKAMTRFVTQHTPIQITRAEEAIAAEARNAGAVPGNMAVHVVDARTLELVGLDATVTPLNDAGGAWQVLIGHVDTGSGSGSESESTGSESASTGSESESESDTVRAPPTRTLLRLLVEFDGPGAAVGSIRGYSEDFFFNVRASHSSSKLYDTTGRRLFILPDSPLGKALGMDALNKGERKAWRRTLAAAEAARRDRSLMASGAAAAAGDADAMIDPDAVPAPRQRPRGRKQRRVATMDRDDCDDATKESSVSKPMRGQRPRARGRPRTAQSYRGRGVAQDTDDAATSPNPRQHVTRSKSRLAARAQVQSASACGAPLGAPPKPARRQTPRPSSGAARPTATAHEGLAPVPLGSLSPHCRVIAELDDAAQSSSSDCDSPPPAPAPQSVNDRRMHGVPGRVLSTSAGPPHMQAQSSLGKRVRVDSSSSSASSSGSQSSVNSDADEAVRPRTDLTLKDDPAHVSAEATVPIEVTAYTESNTPSMFSLGARSAETDDDEIDSWVPLAVAIDDSTLIVPIPAQPLAHEAPVATLSVAAASASAHQPGPAPVPVAHSAGVIVSDLDLIDASDDSWLPQDFWRKVLGDPA